MKYYLGIDPGITGGFACVDSNGQLQTVYSMPVLKVGGKNIIDAHSIIDLFYLNLPYPITFAYLEEQHPMPKQGLSSTFKTGYGYGLLVSALTAKGIPFATIRATAWKRKVSCPRDKEGALLVARRLWPDEDAFSLKKNHGLAEAALLAKLARDSC